MRIFLFGIFFIHVFTSCGSSEQNIALGVAAGIGIAANTPGSQIEQTYYLGTFDPKEQIPPTIYRVRVRGQASILSDVKFGSGWVPAQYVDSLNSHVRLQVDDQGNISYNKEADNDLENINKLGRRMIQFGPEGFREVPSEHRLVIVMGANPSAFFQAVDKTLGSLSPASIQKVKSDFMKQIYKEQLDSRKFAQELNEMEVQ